MYKSPSLDLLFLFFISQQRLAIHMNCVQCFDTLWIFLLVMCHLSEAGIAVCLY